MGCRVLIQPATQGIVGVSDRKTIILKMHQPIEQVPLQSTALTIVPTQCLVATIVYS